MRALSALVLAAVLAGCAARGPAPVIDRNAHRGSSMERSTTSVATSDRPRIEPSTTGFHVVGRGDTLYAIAFANGLDVREVAAWNQLDNPDRIQVGQRLRLTPPAGAEVRPLAGALPIEAKPLDAATPVAASGTDAVVREPQAVLLPWSEANWQRVQAPAPATTVTAASSHVSPPPAVATAAPAAATPAAPASGEPRASQDGWQWPADGVLAARFGGNGGKGIDIVGPRNSEVRAAAAGKVVYSGTGLRGYGRLLIIKHAGDFLSAYAHNESVAVKEGDQVSSGQVIARMGDSDADRVKLHFEIRRYGKPLDPLGFLPERS